MATNEVKDVELSIEFAGVCLYVIHRKEERDPKRTAAKERVRRVTVLMPNCLPPAGVPGKDRHEDDTEAVRHVPYLLMNLANLTAFDPPIPLGAVPDGPQFGVVRRLSREEISFEPDGPGEGIDLKPSPLPLPDLSFLKDAIKIKGEEDLLSDISRNTRPELNARLILKDGEFVTTTVGGSGKGNWNEQADDWAGSIKWTRTIKMVPEKDFLTIRIRSWDDKEKDTRVQLRPVTRGSKEVIELKVALLCENNPLEWKEFEPRIENEKKDIDFKWLFRLFDPKDGDTVHKALGGGDLPCPRLKPREARIAGSTGCTGGQFGLP